MYLNVLKNISNRNIEGIEDLLSIWILGDFMGDIHPRWSPNGKSISIDFTHQGIRKSYMIDISKLLKKR